MASSFNFGSILEVDIREGWESEAGSFTPWLADHIDLLEGTLDIEIDTQSIETEVNVGGYRADIRCRDAADDTVVLIENQLEKTDHRHLGQLLMYAAGLDAFKLVWIAKTFSDEHSAALDWLNRVTPSEYAFFGLEIKLWRIDESRHAPRLEIVSKPNDWERSPSISQELTPTKRAYLSYWQRFKEHLHDTNSSIHPQKPQPQNWMFFAAGRAGFAFQGSVKMNGSEVSVNIPIEYFGAFEAKKTEYEEKLRVDLTISRGKKGYSRLITSREFQIASEDQWDSCMAWMKENLENFDLVFREDIKDASTTEVADVDSGN